MTLTEKVKASIGGYTYKVFVVTALSGGGATTGVQKISTGAVAMNDVKLAIFTPAAIVMSTTSTATNQQMVMNKWTSTSGTGTDLQISACLGSATAEVGILECWGS